MNLEFELYKKNLSEHNLNCYETLIDMEVIYPHIYKNVSLLFGYNKEFIEYVDSILYQDREGFRNGFIEDVFFLINGMRFLHWKSLSQKDKQLELDFIYG
jgi:hypothetical protein